MHLQTPKPEEKPVVATETEAAVPKPTEPVVNMQRLQKLNQHPQKNTYIMHLHREDVCSSLGKTELGKTKTKFTAGEFRRPLTHSGDHS